MEFETFRCFGLSGPNASQSHDDCLRLSELPPSTGGISSQELDALVSSVYGFPSVFDASLLYGLGFILIFAPWLIAFAIGQIKMAIRLID